MFMDFPEIILLAGGLGTRLRDAVPDLPKAMAPVNNKPFLEYQLDYINRFGPRKVILSTGYLSNSIENYFGSGYKNLDLIYSFENEPLGTGGAIRLAFSHVCSPHAMVMNADTMFRINLDSFFQSHIENLANVSIALRKVDDISRYGAVEINEESEIVAFREKSGIKSSGFINGGIYLIKTRFFKGLDLPEKFSLENEMFPAFRSHKKYFGAIFDNYFLDIGIPEDYNRAQCEFNEFKD